MRTSDDIDGGLERLARVNLNWFLRMGHGFNGDLEGFSYDWVSVCKFQGGVEKLYSVSEEQFGLGARATS